MLVLTSSVILLVIVAVTARRDGATNQAQAILDRRLAAGEIDDTGHRERTAALTHQAQDADPGPRRAIIGSVAAVARMLIAAHTPPPGLPQRITSPVSAMQAFEDPCCGAPGYRTARESCWRRATRGSDVASSAALTVVCVLASS